MTVKTGKMVQGIMTLVWSQEPRVEGENLLLKVVWTSRPLTYMHTYICIYMQEKI